MPNPLEILLSGRTDQQSMQAMADQLRRKKDISSISMLSGDPTLQGFGSALSGDADLQTKLQVQRNENAAQRDLTAGYYTQLAENSNFNKTMAQRRQAEEERHNRAMEEAANIRASKINSGRIPPMGAQQKATEVVAGVQNVSSLINSFEDDFASSVGMGEGTVSNVMGKTPLGTKGQKDQALWWSEYDLLYTLPTRNKMFGSALTGQEQRSWRQANVSPNSPPDVIKKGLQIMMDLAKKAAVRQLVSDSALYDPSWVTSVYGQIFPVGGGQTETPPEQEETPQAPAGEVSNPQTVSWKDM